MTTKLTKVEAYALDMVADGARSTVEDDMNEDGAVDEEEHEAACDLAMAIVRAIRTDPDTILALARLIADGVTDEDGQ